MDAKSSSVLSGCRDEARQHVLERQFLAKIEMAMRCTGVGGREEGEKCCGMQGCRAGGQPGVRSCNMVLPIRDSNCLNRRTVPRVASRGQLRENTSREAPVCQIHRNQIDW